jgi:hypothetical protein
MSTTYSQFNAVKHVLWSQNHSLMHGAVTWIEQTLSEAVASDSKRSDENKNLAIKQVLGLLPYFITRDRQSIQIPVQQDGDWISATFNITLVPLLPSLFPSDDQFYAYGLTPTDPTLDCLLLYKGTTYPADHGFWTTLAADLFPFSDIGKPIMWFGRKRIQDWLQSKPTGVHAIGLSLGGALALMSHSLPNILSVTGINPALPSASATCSNSTVIINDRDIISKIGIIPQDTDVIQASTTATKIPAFLAHIQPWIVDPETSLQQLTSEEKQETKYKAWWALYWVARPLAFCLLLPFYILHLVYAYIKDFIQWLFQPVSPLFSKTQTLSQQLTSKIPPVVERLLLPNKHQEKKDVRNTP